MRRVPALAIFFLLVVNQRFTLVNFSTGYRSCGYDRADFKDPVQRDALEAQANDLITHLQHSRKQTLPHTLVTNNELRGTKLQTLRFTFITRSSAEL